ncbi:LysM domain-containing protein [Melissococcus plutonius]|uniref:Aggregation promoting factor n=2 Tax=Melissococcus plutonius TaxID=33970 RepID=F3YCB5_MELPT|nr:LysM domain-containing protein [Melissococcus plutonius]BAL61624.1 aggregation promoting factor [Melissococcus plutonius DAT561]AIM25355.1 aggregation promoting factor [Melissococcus plutonius S1]KMT24071.1 aggregation promoting factor [Melissococcus plutonius]KMT24224.1 aggregation promoting factor [Melissococcus plutonius]KMT25569.1 aggregation promoting factor [Melissococcus plutonius]
MKSLKAILLGTTLAAGFGLFLGASNAHADSLYTVQSGDTLSAISKQFSGGNQLIQRIAQDNSIANIDMIYTGQQLTIKTADQQAEPVQAASAQQAAPVQQKQASQPVQQPAPASAVTNQTSAVDSNSAKEWIAQRESSGSYNATNGKYIGRYQLDASYLNGDYSPANQERTADNYVAQRYGSWEQAQTFWMSHGWY